MNITLKQRLVVNEVILPEKYEDRQKIKLYSGVKLKGRKGLTGRV